MKAGSLASKGAFQRSISSTVSSEFNALENISTFRYWPVRRDGYNIS